MALRLRFAVVGPAVLAAALALGGCADDAADSTATLYLMDAPPAGVTSVVVHVASVQVHVDDKGKSLAEDASSTAIDKDGKWQTLAVNKSIDLVKAQGETAAVKLGTLGLPEGKITQIRLLLDSAQPNTATANGKTCNLDLSKVKDGIKINHVFKALDTGVDQNHQAWLDFRLDEALQASGDCYLLKPVLKLQKFTTAGKDVKF